jgi:hypothetical protein
MKIVKNLLAAAILASAIASSSYAGDVGFPPGMEPPPVTSPPCDNVTPVVGPDGEIVPPAPCVAPGDESTRLALELIIALALLPRP